MSEKPKKVRKPATGKAKAKPKAPAKSRENKPAGRWKPGQSGNPAGRKPGVPNLLARLVRERLEENAEAIVDALIERAVLGSTDALELCLARMAAPIKRADVEPYPLRTITSTADATAALSRLAADVASGLVCPDHAQAIRDTLTSFVRVVDVANMDRRVQQLEAALAAQEASRGA